MQPVTQPISCQACRVGSLTPGLKTVRLTRDAASITTRNVPVMVCDTCQEWATTAVVSANLRAISEAGLAAGLKEVDYAPPASAD